MKNMNDSSTNNTVNTTPTAPALVTPPPADHHMTAFLARLRRPR